MRKMKKFWAIVLAFILAVTLLPIMGNEEVRAEGVSGYYRWYMDRSGNSVFEMEGSPVVSGLSDYVTTGGNARLYASDYLDESGAQLKNISVTSHGVTKTYERSARISTDPTRYVTFTAPCDGTIEMCYKPGGTSSISPTYLRVNGEEVGEAIELEEGSTNFQHLAADQTWKYEMSVSKDKSYKIDANADIGLSQIIFEPSPVSALGASYRETTQEYQNGIRFGSTIDKTVVNGTITESGTLVALKSTMDAKSVTELTMDSVDSVCRKVIRKNYIKDDENTLEYAVAIVGISEEQKNTVLVARPYVVVDGVTYYGYQVEGTWNSVQAQVKALQ